MPVQSTCCVDPRDVRRTMPKIERNIVSDFVEWVTLDSRTDFPKAQPREHYMCSVSLLATLSTRLTCYPILQISSVWYPTIKIFDLYWEQTSGWHVEINDTPNPTSCIKAALTYIGRQHMCIWDLSFQCNATVRKLFRWYCCLFGNRLPDSVVHMLCSV